LRPKYDRLPRKFPNHDAISPRSTVSFQIENNEAQRKRNVLMAQADIGGKMIDAAVLDILTRERSKALSTREWKFRLAGYGYAINDVKGAQVVTTVPHDIELGVMPTHVA
jgi:hypothetical protein